MLYGPHGAPDFFTDDDIDTFFATAWKVHYNSEPHRRAPDRPEAALGAHGRRRGRAAPVATSTTTPTPSARSTSPATCRSSSAPTARASAASSARRRSSRPSSGRWASSRPATPCASCRSRWRRRAGGSTMRRSARSTRSRADAAYAPLRVAAATLVADPRDQRRGRGPPGGRHPPGRRRLPAGRVRAAGARPGLRFRVHALMQALAARAAARASSTSRPASARCRSTTTTARLPRERLLAAAGRGRGDAAARPTTSRCRRASSTCRCPGTIRRRGSRSEKYMQSVRADAPWCPSNIEFIRRINGLDSVDDVQRIVFDASYLVLGLGDVYLGAPVATPLDPRHRLVTTKYNPARTWTPENAVGIGGAYLCVYGMEGPGGYQFVGRTVQMWNRFRADAPTSATASPGCCASSTRSASIRSASEELLAFRAAFPRGRRRAEDRGDDVPVRRLPRVPRRQRRVDRGVPRAPAGGLRRGARALGRAAAAARGRRRAAPPTQRQRARRARSPSAPPSPAASGRSPFRPGTRVAAGDRLVVLETMKMETPVLAPAAGVVVAVLLRARRAGAPGSDADGSARRRVGARSARFVTSCESPSPRPRGAPLVQHPRIQVGCGRGAAAGCSSTRNGPPARRQPTRAIQVCGRAVAGATSVATGA